MTVIDEYLENIEPPKKAELERVRKLLKQIVPDTEETIGYGMPVFKYKGKYLLGIAAFKNHMSLFPGPEVVDLLKTELNNHKISKGTIQFTLESPIPDQLLKDIIENCLKRIS